MLAPYKGRIYEPASGSAGMVFCLQSLGREHCGKMILAMEQEH
jgi:hypothetical protein